MTPVGTPPPPPPRLPVRDPSTARQRPWGSVSPMLNRLAAEHATGVLVRERGTLYLSEGRVVHAESPATPGIDVLLTAAGAIDPEGWRRAVEGAEADPERSVGRTLISQGMLSQGQLELCHLGSVFDAAYFALAPSSAPGHFRYGAWHWMGPVRPVPVSALERETMRRRSLLNRIWPDPSTDTAPLSLIRSDGPAPVCARRKTIMELVDGRRTATDIARALGRPAFHTLVDLRRLAAAGLVAATHRPARPPSPPAPAEPTEPAPAPAPAAAAVPSPAPASAAGSASAPAPADTATPLPEQPTARPRPAPAAAPRPAPPSAPRPAPVVPPVQPLPPLAPQPARPAVRPPDDGLQQPARHHPDVDVPLPPRPPGGGRHRAGRTPAAPPAPRAVPPQPPHPPVAPTVPAVPPPRAPVTATGSQVPPTHFADPDVALLTRLRAALEAL
ncbi:hypothetical protein [Streptomyces sp. NPDC005012]|uniref:hypothetical protein n=1 Tax=Streptomyces sp. NPDC005012 TaxID=3154558 RepID=UPI0033A885FC